MTTKGEEIAHDACPTEASARRIAARIDAALAEERKAVAGWKQVAQDFSEEADDAANEARAALLVKIGRWAGEHAWSDAAGVYNPVVTLEELRAFLDTLGRKP